MFEFFGCFLKPPKDRINKCFFIEGFSGTVARSSCCFPAPNMFFESSKFFFFQFLIEILTIFDLLCLFHVNIIMMIFRIDSLIKSINALQNISLVQLLIAILIQSPIPYSALSNNRLIFVKSKKPNDPSAQIVDHLTHLDPHQSILPHYLLSFEPISTFCGCARSIQQYLTLYSYLLSKSI